MQRSHSPRTRWSRFCWLAVAGALVATLGCKTDDGAASAPPPEEAAQARAPAAEAVPATAPPATDPAATRPAVASAEAPPASRVGDTAPDFTLASNTGEEISLSDFAGKKAVLLAFYPKAFTPGCTTEMSTLRDEYATFGDGVQVLGVSMDPVETIDRFHDELNLPFPLLADTDGKVSAAYDSVMKRGPLKLSSREVVLVGKDGRIVYRDDDYRVGDEADWKALVAAVEKVK